MYNFELLEEMFEISKSLKTEYVIFTGFTVLGTDQFQSKMAVIHCNKEYPRISYNQKEMGDFLKARRETDVLRQMNNILFISPEVWVPINNNLLDIEIIGKYHDIYTKNFNIWGKDLTDDEEFREACSGKVADGLSVLMMDIPNSYINDDTVKQFPISVYGSLLPINKKDKIRISINSEFGSPTFLVKFTITKSKNLEIEYYVNYIFI